MILAQVRPNTTAPTIIYQAVNPNILVTSFRAVPMISQQVRYSVYVNPTSSRLNRVHMIVHDRPLTHGYDDEDWFDYNGIALGVGGVIGVKVEIARAIVFAIFGALS